MYHRRQDFKDDSHHSYVSLLTLIFPALSALYVYAVAYKESSQFASHLGKKTEAVSVFARSKTIQEQREYLPIYQCREDLLRVVRDHAGE